jgi:hypothetical protein
MVSLGSKSTFLMDLYQFLCPMFHATPCANQNNYYSTLVSVVGLKVSFFFAIFIPPPWRGWKPASLLILCLIYSPTSLSSYLASCMIFLFEGIQFHDQLVLNEIDNQQRFHFRSSCNFYFGMPSPSALLLHQSCIWIWLKKCTACSCAGTWGSCALPLVILVSTTVGDNHLLIR